MGIQIRKAERKKAKLRLGIAAPSGAGKTYSALLLAFGLGGKVGIIDTEHGSADLYAHLGDYDVITIEAPYEVRKYLEAIKAFEAAGYSTIIIDSLSHAWAGEGGLLDKQGKIADSDKYKNSYAAWRTVTPEHNALVEAMLRSKCHIIATMRSKQEYILETNDKGKQVPKKIGMAPIQREGMEYEFTVMLDINIDHVASSSKDRTSLLDGKFFKITTETGQQLLEWLESGKETVIEEAASSQSDQEHPKKRAVGPGLSESQMADLKIFFKEANDLDQLMESFKKAWIQANEDQRLVIKPKYDDAKARIEGSKLIEEASRKEVEKQIAEEEKTKREKALENMADNAREIGLDYE